MPENIAGLLLPALLISVWLLVIVRVIVRAIKNRYAPVKTVKAVVIDKHTIETFSKYSGTGKRESQSEAFSKAPFTYSFTPVPMSEAGGYFVDSPSVEFSVNKTCDNLDMTNEFMRFLISREELNRMASLKRLVTPTTDLSFDSVYEPFGHVPTERVLSPEAIGITDPLAVQVRLASYLVGTGAVTVDEAVSRYGSFE